MKEASGFFICGVPHREDLHRNGYQYAHQFSRARRRGGLPRQFPLAGATEASAILTAFADRSGGVPVDRENTTAKPRLRLCLERTETIEV
ncbi:hypothetical protein [Bradyrhizobium japonicum]|uniref:hypothetical protein n=1 Tax=Bradyrhizobium japonicum TaxID=375 RepID=UPI00201375A3|nr:hypothetical protein [Bradyrhizobium japonicum]